FGEACLATNRFETIVPRFFNLAMRETARMTGDWRAIYRRPDLEAKQLALARALVAEPTRQAELKSNLEFLAVNAFLAGDLRTAAATWRKLPGKLSLGARKKLESFGVPDFEQQMAALQTP